MQGKDRRLKLIVGMLVGSLLVAACSESSGPVAAVPPATTRVPGGSPSLPSVSTESGASLPTVPGDQTSDTFSVAPGSTTTRPTTTTTVAPSTTTTTVPPTTTITQPPEILPGDVLFDTGKWTLAPTAEAELQTVAREIDERAPNAALFIVGHTDSRGSVESNLELSEKRAASVASWFIDWGFDRGSVTSEGRGESELLLPDVDAGGTFISDAGALNRRVAIYVAP